MLKLYSALVFHLDGTVLASACRNVADSKSQKYTCEFYAVDVST